MRVGWSAVRARGQLLLLPAAAFAVHQLRYLLAYGAGAGAQLQRTGHSYLHSLVPWLMCLIALATAGFLRSLGRAFSRQTTVARYTASFAALWTACAASLVTIFAAQEFLEGLFATGHPMGLAGIFGYGGWWAIPAALCVGLVLAAVFHGARWVVARVAGRARRTATRRPCPPAHRPALVVLPHATAPLLDGWSSRGPPR